MARYADCPSVEVEVHIAAPVSHVWALVTDLNLPARFSSEFREAWWLDDAAGPSLGARFQGRNRHPAGGEWETTSVVVDYEPERAFGWAVGDPAEPSARWRFRLEPAGDGVQLTQWAQMGPAPSGLTPAIKAMPEKEERIVARRLEEFRTNMLATLNGIKALAEAAP